MRADLRIKGGNEPWANLRKALQAEVKVNANYAKLEGAGGVQEHQESVWLEQSVYGESKSEQRGRQAKSRKALQALERAYMVFQFAGNIGWFW